MNFSIDTNVIIGIVNDKDRLHDISLNLMRDKQNQKLIICQTALKESQTVFRTRINEIMGDIIQYLPKFFQHKKMSLLESQILLIEIFKELKTQKPMFSNFLNLVYFEILTFLQTDFDIDKIPSFLSQLSLKYSNFILPKLENTHSIEAIISLNFKTLSDVKQSTKEIYFKDTYDERIFQELMTNLSDVIPIELISDDIGFIKNSKIGFEKISNDLKYSNNIFSCKLLQESIIS